ncbi:hypothetical protein O9G_004115 [Rozella allomycis CSF55]|uniref:Timeless N-terminal domain-containing protein n=1 Tax=Rozella allomycis (strain CSF55) TaxID=988480 RepID=A0A075B1T1_ROZAC|nr:hypothetical protein O9G_004115 [Rozella allomycis CSF55]|eukprot:EPZ34748.1 hypothetical protein O9G_004115 [Rozella allomycis CSF55]
MDENEKEEKQERLKPFIHSLLLNLSLGIGVLDNGVFVPGENSLDCLKDMKRLLKQDYYSREYFSFETLGKFNVIEKHLVPMLMNTTEDVYCQLFGKEMRKWRLVEICVPLTWNIEEEGVNFVEIHQNYKQAMWGVVCGERMNYEENKNMLQLVLSLIRNLMVIEHQKDEINVLEQSRFVEIFVSICGEMNEGKYPQWITIMIGIIHGIIKDKCAIGIYKEEIINKLSLLKQKEKRVNLRPRHTRFYSNEFAVDNGKQILEKKCGGKVRMPIPKGTRKLVTSFCNTSRTGDIKTIKITKKIMKSGMNGLISKANRLIETNNLLSQDDVEKVYDIISFCCKFYHESSNEVEATKRIKDRVENKDRVDNGENKDDRVEDKENIDRVDMVDENINHNNKDDNNSEGLKVNIIDKESDKVVDNPPTTTNAPYLMPEMIQCVLNRSFILTLANELASSFEEKKWKQVEILVKSLTEMIKLINEEELMNIILEGNVFRILYLILKDGMKFSVQYLSIILRGIFNFMKLLKRMKNENLENFEIEFGEELIILNILRLLYGKEILDKKEKEFCLKILHKLLIKHNMTPVFYKISILSTFFKMIEMKLEKDLFKFISYFIKIFMKKVSEYPILIMEILYPKQSYDVKYITLGKDPRMQYEKNTSFDLYVAPEFSKIDQIKIVASILIQKNKTDYINLLISFLSNNESQDFKPLNQKEFKMFTNKYFHLLLDLIGLIKDILNSTLIEQFQPPEDKPLTFYILSSKSSIDQSLFQQSLSNLNYSSSDSENDEFENYISQLKDKHEIEKENKLEKLKQLKLNRQKRKEGVEGEGEKGDEGEVERAEGDSEVEGRESEEKNKSGKSVKGTFKSNKKHSTDEMVFSQNDDQNEQIVDQERIQELLLELKQKRRKTFKSQEFNDSNLTENSKLNELNLTKESLNEEDKENEMPIMKSQKRKAKITIEDDDD